MRHSEPWGAIAVPMEAHSKQRDLPLRMHEPDKSKYLAKGTKGTLILLIGGNCDLWCPGWDSKDLGGRPEQGPVGTSRSGQQDGIRAGDGKATSKEHPACRQKCDKSKKSHL